MTTTDKPVSRVTRADYRVLYVSPRRIVVRIGPGDVLSFRERGRRQWFYLPARSRAGRKPTDATGA